ncbi:hypothetical protein [Neorhizobium sp. T25_13]|uniref:hypothetical protein n=1 Tax=Neorhizobium sp. T25_13 TaxID=2093830 RepID=UPI000CF97514|nr:hypothetical protein [Neorhizobium sp. T25_13]
MTNRQLTILSITLASCIVYLLIIQTIVRPGWHPSFPGVLADPVIIAICAIGLFKVWRSRDAS